MNKCRVCGADFFETPLLIYENMPKAAQYMPEDSTLNLDLSVTLKVCQCSCCGLVQLSNAEVPYYREVIRASGFSNEMIKFREAQFSEFVEINGLKSKKILEVGCGKGEYLEILNRLVPEAYGIEYSIDSVNACKVKGLKVEADYIENPFHKIKNQPFDAFFLFNCFEHAKDPNVLLKGLYQNLSDEAWGIVEVPNFQHMIDENQFTEFTIDHLMYFTRKTLEFVLNKNGFQVVKFNEEWDAYILSAVVKKRKPLDLSVFDTMKTDLVSEIREYINHFPKGRVAIWGAGHQALMTMALAELGEMVNFVIDSAPFKQGKYTHVTHIPIVAPDQLDDSRIDAVLIMGAGYSDEIAEIIKTQHKDMHIAILRKTNIEVVK